jgi:hypothetical protein
LRRCAIRFCRARRMIKGRYRGLEGLEGKTGLEGY